MRVLSGCCWELGGFPRGPVDWAGNVGVGTGGVLQFAGQACYTCTGYCGRNVEGGRDEGFPGSDHQPTLLHGLVRLHPNLMTKL